MELSNQWAKCLLGAIVNLRNGYAFKSPEYQEQGIPIIRISDINDGVVEISNSKNIYPHEDFEKFIVESGDILIAMSGATTGKFGIYKGTIKAYQNQRVGNLKLISEENTNKLFVYYLLYSLKRRIEKDAYGGAQPNISGSKVEAIEIALPPLKEQHRIVAKIEELFSELDKGIENLKTAQSQLKVYRQALLKHAFEGKLTAQWRAERNVTPAKAGVQPLNDMDSRLPPAFARVTGNDEPLESAATLLKRIQQERMQRYQQQLADWEKSPSAPLLQRGKPTSTAPIPPLEKGGRGGISKPKPPKFLPPLTTGELAELPELPEGWGWVKLEAIVEEGPINGYSPQAVKFETGTKAIALTATTSGKFDGSYFKYIDEAIPNESSLWLRFGDILIQRGNTIEYVGVPAIYKGHANQFIYPDLIMKIRVVQFIDADYTVFSLKEERARSWLRRRAVGAAGSMPKINHSTLRSLPIPICSNLEQQQIVQELESKLSEADQLDQTITTSLQQAEALRQSILKKAFSGQLVPQDPNDEPASELLARIRAEKGAQPNNKKGRL